MNTRPKSSWELRAERAEGALRIISQADRIAWLRRNCEKRYGLAFEEALEMAYENVVMLAAAALKGVRKKRSASARTAPAVGQPTDTPT